MKYQVLFFLKMNETIPKNFVCCGRNWRFKGSSVITSRKVVIMSVIASKNR